eukprot:8572352-Pyramimonas_sp.AAC.1
MLGQPSSCRVPLGNLCRFPLTPRLALLAVRPGAAKAKLRSIAGSGGPGPSSGARWIPSRRALARLGLARPRGAS